MILHHIAYGIEHFQISQYSHKKGDQGKAAEGAIKNREKLRNDRDFSLAPSLANLCASLKSGLKTHMKNANSYRENILNIKTVQTKSFRLVFLIEDTSEQASYVQKYDTSQRNPLLFDDIANSVLEYMERLWAVVYIGGNSFGKIMQGYTLDELSALKKQGKLLDIKQYRTLRSDEQYYVSKDDVSKDEHIVTLKLYDRMCVSD